MNRYRIRISVDGKRKLYYIEDQENYDIGVHTPDSISPYYSTNAAEA